MQENTAGLTAIGICKPFTICAPFKLEAVFGFQQIQGKGATYIEVLSGLPRANYLVLLRAELAIHRNDDMPDPLPSTVTNIEIDGGNQTILGSFDLPYFRGEKVISATLIYSWNEGLCVSPRPRSPPPIMRFPESPSLPLLTMDVVGGGDLKYATGCDESYNLTEAERKELELGKEVDFGHSKIGE